VGDQFVENLPWNPHESRLQWPTMRAAWADRPWVTVLFGLVAAILTWDPLQPVPAPGLDPSWVLGLNLGAADGLDHGTEIVFTYGPLGFLQEPMVIDGLLATSGAIYTLAIRAALAVSLLYGARRSLPWLPAAGLALVAMTITPREIVPLTLVAVWCVIALSDPDRPWAGRLVAIGGGAIAGIELLVKINVGLTILAVVVVSTAALPGSRVRNLGTMAGALLGTAGVLWFAAGQGLGNIDDYASSSFEIVAGYSQAMQLEQPSVSWDWWAALVAGAGAIAAAVLATGSRPAARRIPIVIVAALLVLALFKFGFVRHDSGHVGAFFGGLVAIWIGLRWRGAARLAPVAAIGVLLLFYAEASNELTGGAMRPDEAVEQLHTLVVPGERDEAAEAARADMRATYALDPPIIERIGDEPVDVRPWEIGLAWAYDLQWRPLPVLQDYQAYTPALDELNAEKLASDEGPRFVVRHFGFGQSPSIGLDGRFGSFDVPLQTLALLCLYQPAVSSSSYQLLERSENRCGEPRALGSDQAEYGEAVAVPAGDRDEAVFARIRGAGPEGLERLRTLVFRAAERTVSLRIGRAPLPPRNAESGLLLSAPPGTDFEPPYALSPDTETIAIDSDDGPLSSEGPLELDFYALPIEPLGGRSVSLD
jgi:hypothetical protein